MQSEPEQQFEQIYQSLCKDERFCSDLKVYFERIMKAELLRFEAYEAFASFLDGQAKEPFKGTPSMMAMLDEMKNAIKAVNEKVQDQINPDSDKGLIKLIKSKILLSLVDNQAAIVVNKKALAEYKEKAQNCTKLEQKKNDLLAKNNDKYVQMEQQLQEAKREKLEKGQTFNFTFKTYTEDKNEEIKGLFKHFLNRLLVISGAGLQYYSQAMNKIHNTDERAEVKAQLSEFGVQKKRNN